MAKFNTSIQYYKGIPLTLIVRYDYGHKFAKRFVINGTNQNVWIPNKHLADDGTILPDQKMDYIFIQAERQLELAGYELYFRPIGGESCK